MKSPSGLLAAALATTAAGCSSSGASPSISAPPTGVTSSPSTAAPSATPDASARQAVLSQYRAFWAVLPSTSNAAASRRRAMVSPYATNPELDSLLTGMARQDRQGEEIYGVNIVRPKLVSISVTQGIAVIADCQDSSHSGVERRSDHKRLTVGVDRNPVSATIHLGADGTWRIAFITYPKSSC
jgi:hypothetical protein